MTNKLTPGQEFRIKAIKTAIRKVGDYERFVKVWSNWKQGDYTYFYKIDQGLSKHVIEKLRMSIELEAGRLNFEVSLQI
jgi:hypothetical protein